MDGGGTPEPGKNSIFVGGIRAGKISGADLNTTLFRHDDVRLYSYTERGQDVDELVKILRLRKLFKIRGLAPSPCIQEKVASLIGVS